MKMLVFTAIWCRPCQELKKYLNVLDDVIPYEIVDVDEQGEMALKHNVRGVPTMIILDGDKEIARQVGSISGTKLVEFVNNAQT